MRQTPYLVLGTAQLGMRYGVANRRGAPTDQEVFRLLQVAFELGVRALDTAAAYGEAEARIGSYFARYGNPVGLRVATKLPALGRGLSPGEVTRQVGEIVESSRARLGVETIAWYLIHDSADLHEYGHYLIPALLECRSAGLIDRIGVSVYTPQEVSRAVQCPDIDVLQYPFNAFDRRFGQAWVTRTPRVTKFARSVLLQGLLALSPADMPKAVEHARPWLDRFRLVAREFEMSGAEAAVRYAVTRGGADGVVVGADSEKQLRELHSWWQRPAPDAFIAAVEAVTADVPPDVVDPRRWAES